MQHLIDTKPRVATCNRCSQIVLAAMSSGLRAAVDPTPLNFGQMREALIDGHHVYRMYIQAGKPTRLEYVTVAMLRLPAAPYGTYATSHGCGCHAMDATAFEEAQDPSQAPVSAPQGFRRRSPATDATPPPSEPAKPVYAPLKAARCAKCKGLIPEGDTDRFQLEWPVTYEREIKIRSGAQIELTGEHVKQADEVGSWRNNNQVKAGKKHTAGMADKDGLWAHQLGARGELAYALYLGIEWTPSDDPEPNTRDGDGCGEGIDVKTTNYPGGRMWLKPNAHEDLLYVLVNPAKARDYTRFRVEGMITGHAAKRQEHWGSFGVGRPNCYIVPREALSKPPAPGKPTIMVKEQGYERWVIHAGPDGCPMKNTNGSQT